MKLLRTFIYKVLYEHVLSFILDKYLEMEIPINVGGVYLTLRNSQTFPKPCTIPHPTSIHASSSCSASSAALAGASVFLLASGRCGMSQYCSNVQVPVD